jgi:hypothetical protein
MNAINALTANDAEKSEPMRSGPGYGGFGNSICIARKYSGRREWPLFYRLSGTPPTVQN